MVLLGLSREERSVLSKRDDAVPGAGGGVMVVVVVVVGRENATTRDRENATRIVDQLG